jgi:magnesium-protoporphyrin IX monomethyl ester (oxidative) cyclase
MKNRKFKKILLISPHQTYPIDLKSEYQSYLPIGILCIAAVAEKLGCKVKILDCLATEHEETQGNNITFGQPIDYISQEIATFNPHIVGISNPFTMFINNANIVAKLVKSINKKCIVILGGVSASIETLYMQLIKKPYYDIIIKGEGEKTVKELLENYSVLSNEIKNLDKIKGIVYKSENKFINNENRKFIEDLSSLPLPAFHLIDIEKTLKNKYYSRWRLNQFNKRSMPVFTSRGCPYNCVFCSVHAQVGYRHRTYSNEYVLEYLKQCKEKHGVTHFHFEDDNLTCNKIKAKQLMKKLCDLNITWDTPNGVRADTIDEELFSLMVFSGLTSISVASESGNDVVLKTIIKKHMSTDSIVKVASLADKYELPCNVFFVVGFPGETLENILDTIKFAKNLSKNYGTINNVFVANPLPGTELEKIAVINNYMRQNLSSEDYFKAIRINQTSIIETKEFDKIKIFNLLKSELKYSEYSVHGTSIPMFWYDDDRTWNKVHKIFPKMSKEKTFVWEWKG